MTPAAHVRLGTLSLAPRTLLLAAVAFGLGCGEAMTANTTSVRATPAAVLDPQAPEPAKRAAKDKDAASTSTLATNLAVLTVALTADEPTAKADAVTLIPVKYDEFRARLAANKAKAKYTLVDAWATNCGPCKENFPHLVDMHRKFAKQGLAVVSLTLDDTSDPKALEEARKFLKDKKAVFTNYLMDEEFGVGFEKLGINAIPAVFVYGPDGKEVKRFTLDDAENQFTYEEVEKYVEDLLAGRKPAEGKK